MRKRTLLIAALNAAALLACAPVATTTSAQYSPPPQEHWQGHWERGTDWRPGIRERIADIRKRINGGVEHGDLTRAEADRLRYELDSVIDNLERMKSDGYLSERERDRVVAQLNGVSDDVWRLRHNRAARY